MHNITVEDEDYYYYWFWVDEEVRDSGAKYQIILEVYGNDHSY